jgi:hypothetical protein
MPGCYKIDKERRLVMSTGYGVVTNADLLDHQNKLIADPDFDPTYSQLADFAHVTKVEVTAADIHRMAERDVFAPDARRAFVVPDDMAYGMVRMFEMLREAKGENGIRVFRTLEEGLGWVFSEKAKTR